jgi:hypothetical protein
LVKHDSAAITLLVLPQYETTIGLALNMRVRYDGAKEMSQQTLELMERWLRKEHPSTLTTVYCLAYL